MSHQFPKLHVFGKKLEFTEDMGRACKLTEGPSKESNPGPSCREATFSNFVVLLFYCLQEEKKWVDI